jgi:cyclopropane-fatty-acyl-phospholipid synthase
MDAVLRHLRCGALTVRLPDGSVQRYEGAAPGPHARVDVRDLRLVRRLVTTGAIGLAEGWIDGDFDSPDLTAVIELAARHLEPPHRVQAPALVERAGRRAWRTLGRATVPRGPLRTTVQHYDLGNDFFASWLDDTMTYSSAWFVDDDMTLAGAQREKYRRLSESAGLRPGMRVLEIGSGWGGFALYAAGIIGCDVTTVTVSRAQATWVEKQVAEAGLHDRIHVRVEDFSTTPGTFDAVVSIEMIESIPRERWALFFHTVRERLAPGGAAGLQIITVGDRHWDASNGDADFIRRYVFPGGQVPSPTVLRDAWERAGLERVSEAGFGASYARTLHEWRARFDAASPAIAELGFDERFHRLWQYYLSYCEAGFRSGRVDVSQIVLCRPSSTERE